MEVVCEPLPEEELEVDRAVVVGDGLVVVVGLTTVVKLEVREVDALVVDAEAWVV